MAAKMSVIFDIFFYLPDCLMRKISICRVKVSISFGNVTRRYVSTGPNRKLTIRFDADVIDYVVFNVKMTELPITKKY